MYGSGDKILWAPKNIPGPEGSPSFDPLLSGLICIDIFSTENPRLFNTDYTSHGGKSSAISPRLYFVFSYIIAIMQMTATAINVGGLQHEDVHL